MVKGIDGPIANGEEGYLFTAEPGWIVNNPYRGFDNSVDATIPRYPQIDKNEIIDILQGYNW